MNHIFCTTSLGFLYFTPGGGIWESVTNAGGFQMAITGMSTVFTGLVVIWAMVILNRKLVNKIENRGKKKDKKQIPDPSLSPMAAAGVRNLEELAAIIGATYAYCEEFEEDHMETLHLQNIEHEVSPWVIVAREQMMRKH